MRFLSLIDGILKLKEAIASFTGQPNQIVATDTLGKIEKSLLPSLELDDLSDVLATLPIPGDILIYAGGYWQKSRPLLSWAWQVYDNQVAAGANPAFRFNSVASSSVRFKPPVNARMLYGVSSTQDVDGFYIDIYVNGALRETLTHSTNNSTVIHQPANFSLLPTEELYVIFRRITANNVDNVAFNMFFVEVY
jgi:hypothetical protein